jgi:hypothetical protein
VWSGECFPALNLWKSASKSKWCTESKVKVMLILPSLKRTCNVLNLSNKVRILDLLKSSVSFIVVGWHYGKNESSSHSIQDKECEISSSFVRSINLFNSNFCDSNAVYSMLFPVMDAWPTVHTKLVNLSNFRILNSEHPWSLYLGYQGSTVLWDKIR